MAKHYTIKIPFSRIIKCGIYSNKSTKITLTTVYKQLKEKYPNKEIYISNAGFFNMDKTFTACFGLKADNIEYSSNWNMPYIAMNDNKFYFIASGETPDNYSDAISGYPVLIEDFKKSSYFKHCIDNSNRGRTMFGYTDNEIIMSCVEDISGTTDFTLDEELNYMLSLKCKYAINLDGGGSSQCNFNGKTIISSRKVNNFIYAIVEPEEQTQSVQTTNTLHVGDSVILKSDAKYASGKSIPIWVKKSKLWCRSINSNGTVTISTKRVGPITGTVPISALSLNISSIDISI